MLFGIKVWGLTKICLVPEQIQFSFLKEILALTISLWEIYLV